MTKSYLASVLNTKAIRPITIQKHWISFQEEKHYLCGLILRSRGRKCVRYPWDIRYYHWDIIDTIQARNDIHNGHNAIVTSPLDLLCQSLWHSVLWCDAPHLKSSDIAPYYNLDPRVTSRPRIGTFIYTFSVFRICNIFSQIPHEFLWRKEPQRGVMMWRLDGQARIVISANRETFQRPEVPLVQCVKAWVTQHDYDMCGGSVLSWIVTAWSEYR